MSRRKTKEEFIADAKKVHGDRYDYSKVEYVNNKTEVCIVCPIHGDFWQIPDGHTNRGQGCNKCAKKQISTTEEFVEKAKKKYGDKYDYSEAEYTLPHIPITIKCNKCNNKFREIALAHLSGAGCDCYKTKKKKSLSLEEYLEKANKIHNNKYDYSNIKEYTRGKSYIYPICHVKDIDGNEHGEFKVRAESHTYGKVGCPECAKIARTLSQKVDLNEFKKRAVATHKDEYDYSLVIEVTYRGYRDEVPIICKKHGVFNQIAKKHVEGQGCKYCKKTKLEQEVEDFLKEHNINYVYFKNDFDWLKMEDSHARQSLDFYLPDYNIAIECQGEQHFYPIDFAGRGEKWAMEQLRRVKKLDNRKQILCEQNGIKLLYYSHIVKDGNINDLNNLLEKIKNE